MGKDYIELALGGVAIFTAIFYAMFGYLWIAFLLAIALIGGGIIIEEILERLGILDEDE